MTASMFTHSGTSRTPRAGFIGTVRSLFDRSDAATAALAASLASELRAQSELSAWVVSLASRPRSERADSLRRAARNLRGDWSTLGTADALLRIATKRALFDATMRELHAA